MVIVCPEKYSNDNLEYEEYFKQYDYELYDFQKWSIESIVKRNDILCAAGTGCGKTLCALFAIDFYTKQNKKVIYTSPIKALSNQKFNEFSLKFPHISIGLITGDIRINPNASVLIMTTEILLNKLKFYESEHYHFQANAFDMDMNDIATIVFDEVHMINDISRGHVWETCLMLTPQHISIIGLSGTLSQPLQFCQWIESLRPEKITCLIQKKKRTIPLIHYSFITTNSSLYKIIKDDALKDKIKKYMNTTHIIQDENGIFNETEFNEMKQMLFLMKKHNIEMSRKHVLNKLCEHLVKNEMLPALCYVFSRKQLEKCAQELTTNLLEFDSKIPYTVDRECEQILRKFPNFEEYLQLPEYLDLLKLVRKGIGIHHAGMLSILREMVEILFSMNFIKILFCTETMSVGINLPVKSTIFTNIHKHDDRSKRLLHGYEFNQASGRAGRLGLDSIGHVIHLHNLFDEVSQIDYKLMLKGTPPMIQSKLKISYVNVLYMIDSKNDFTQKSILMKEVEQERKSKEAEMIHLNEEIDVLKIQIKTSMEILEEYNDIVQPKKTLSQGQRKKQEQLKKMLVTQHPNLLKDYSLFTLMNEKKNQMEKIDISFNVIDRQMKTITDLLYHTGFVDEETQILTVKGKVAMMMKEIPPLLFANLFTENRELLVSLTPVDWVMLFGCFSLETKKEKTEWVQQTNELYLFIEQQMQYYDDFETTHELHYRLNSEFFLNHEMMEYFESWCKAENEMECKEILMQVKKEKNVFCGEFIKALMKINNIALECESICEMLGDVEILHQLKQIPLLTTKFVATNQSLYV
jgi:superfamily II RNA helicase